MFHDVRIQLETALMERATLLLNHVISSEPVAMERLRAHAGRSLRIDVVGWPSWLPAPSGIGYRVTPAGLTEWLGPEPADLADLRITVEASNPARAAARLLGGVKPEVDVSGDAGFAADVDWLIANLRWDVEDDLARVVGAAPARQIGRLAGAVAGGLRQAVGAFAERPERGAAVAPAGPIPR